MLVRAKNGDDSARERLVKDNLALVKYIVKRFLGRGREFDDLFQWGCLGLVKAIDRFDPEYTVQFSTYAVPVIMGEIRRYLRDDGPVHVSRTIHEQAKKIEAFAARFEAEAGRRPGVQEIAEGLQMDSESVVLAMNSRRRIRSLSEPVNGDAEVRLMDVLGTEPMQQVDQRILLSRLIRDLSGEERTIILRRYFQRHTQTQIARDLGISQVQVSRMESRILKRMRQMAGEG
ncbi:MAG: SigB/SigF/SigG family RNA polymerase sigma factor [Clostridia bacterium]|nr:SigB/SigF/SigG family RNA polymerase sigma factor [Clostridia bacterium]